jgi:hypothetical protein
VRNDDLDLLAIMEAVQVVEPRRGSAGQHRSGQQRRDHRPLLPSRRCAGDSDAPRSDLQPRAAPNVSRLELGGDAQGPELARACDAILQFEQLQHALIHVR